MRQSIGAIRGRVTNLEQEITITRAEWKKRQVRLIRLIQSLKNTQTVESRKKEIIAQYGTEPTICYYYYLWNAVDYVGEKRVRASFQSIQGSGNEIIVGDYGSTDGTKRIAKEYGFKVVDVEKTNGILMHESKIGNKVVYSTQCNFVVDMNIHTTYPENIDNFFKKWLKNNDISKDILVARGLFENANGVLERKEHPASCFIYRPFLLKARGYDERTYYGFGTSHYAISLLLDVYDLNFADNFLNDMIHYNHVGIKIPRLKNTFKLGNLVQGHRRATSFVDDIIFELHLNFDEGVKKVVNSYW